MTIADSQPAAAEAKRRWYRVTPDRLVWLVLVVEGLLWLAERFGCFPKGYAVLLAVAGVAVAMLLMLLWFAASLVFRWRFQFSIGSLLVLAVVVAMASGWFAVEEKEARERTEAVAGIAKLQHTAYDDYSWNDWGNSMVRLGCGMCLAMGSSMKSWPSSCAAIPKWHTLKACRNSGA